MKKILSLATLFLGCYSFTAMATTPPPGFGSVTLFNVPTVSQHVYTAVIVGYKNNAPCGETIPQNLTVTNPLQYNFGLDKDQYCPDGADNIVMQVCNEHTCTNVQAYPNGDIKTEGGCQISGFPITKFNHVELVYPQWTAACGARPRSS